MALGVISGFNTTRVVTTAATQITSGPTYVVARLAAGAAACQLDIHNGTTTSAASRVAVLQTGSDSIDELGVPLRCPDGVKVLLSVSTAEAFIYFR